LKGRKSGFPAHTPPGRANAREILAQRYARGEITPEQYREMSKALEESK